MELIDLLRVVRRWLWLIIAVVVVTELALWLGMRSADPVYTATVRLQISTPQREEVAAYDEYRSISLRDEITVAINNLTDLLQSDEMYRRTMSQLGLEGNDAHYTLEAARAKDADFIDVAVEARTPALAAEIANAHVHAAIAYYGELRAKSTNVEKELFAEQLRAAEAEFQAAEDAFALFEAQHGITTLQNELDTYKQLLEQLGLERDQRLLKEVTTAAEPLVEVDKLIAQRQKEMERVLSLAPRYNLLEEDVQQARDRYRLLSQGQNATGSQPAGGATDAELAAAETALLAAEQALAEFRTGNGIFSIESQLATQQKLLEELQLERDQRLLEETTEVNDPVGEVDKLIAQRQQELDQLTSLAPQYNVLAQKVAHAREAYQHLLGKYSEAGLKVSAVQAANFIQVIRPAHAPDGSDSNWPKLAVLALVGSLGVGVVLAFLLQYVSGFGAGGVTVPVGERAGYEGSPQKTATEQGPIPAPGHLASPDQSGLRP